MKKKSLIEKAAPIVQENIELAMNIRAKINALPSLNNTKNPLLRPMLEAIKFPLKYNRHGQFITDSQYKHILDIRGWGWIQHLVRRPAQEQIEMQDALGEYICELLNKEHEKEIAGE